MHDPRTKYQQLLQDLRAELRPQREWCEGRGLFLVVGHFVVGVAGGTWLFSLYWGSRTGLSLAFALGAAGGLLHLANLGHPLRAWKMGWHVRTSWTSRGFFGLNLFLAGAFLVLVPQWLPAAWSPASLAAQAGRLLSIAGMVTIIGYMGFVYTASKAVPFWNSPLHPALYVTYALRGGIAGLLLAQAIDGQPAGGANQLLLLWCFVTATAILLITLEVHGALASGNAAARRSVHDLFGGRVSLSFYGGTLLLGLVVPAWLVWSGLSGRASAGALALLALASIVGDFFMKYSTIRAGVYLPLWTAVAPRRPL